MKNNDFGALEDLFVDMQDQILKGAGTDFALDKIVTLPNWILRALVDIEDCVLAVTNEQKKKMNKNVAKSFTALKTKIKKFLEEKGDDEQRFRVQVDRYRANPQDEESQKSESDDSDSGSGSGSDSDASDDKKKTEKKVVKKKKDDSDDSSSGSDDNDSGSDSDDSSDDGSSSDSDSSGPEEEVEIKEEKGLPKKYAFLKLPREQMTPEQRRWKWVKYEYLPEDMKPFVPAPLGTKRPPKPAVVEDTKPSGTQGDKTKKRGRDCKTK